jgi:hypothetical protein
MSDKQENLHKELELIQSVITRMANNSFLVKGWTMTLISALIAFGKDIVLEGQGGIYYLTAMLVIVIPFWWLDAFFLKQERIFRRIYEKAIKDPNAEKRVRYDLNPRESASGIGRVWKLMRAEVVVWFYLPFLLFILTGIVLKIMHKI